MTDLRAHGLVLLSEVEGGLARAAQGVPVTRRDGQVVAFAIVDAADFEWASRYRWHFNKRGGYVSRQQRDATGRQRRVLLHREVLRLDRRDRREVDHENRDHLDCRRSNLRVCTHAQNHQNRAASGDRGTSSRYRGVAFNRERQMWQAYAWLDGRQRHLGYFDSEEQAAAAAAAWRREHMPFSTN